ncbi:nodulin-related protein 1-like [Momordica charantia]|uniref:Nodulin-related protein 1-like n=1 Tax=Momordica charantia TaxID=3673 RepID=A0A6J1DTQ5_MOMCH|nr:nodulin-related protein 1-like [Momordica charantia]XP_022157122.1 nodulin-related protein 1-like [Momordica charantia]
MDLFSKLSGSTDKPEDPEHHRTSASDLLSSAKLVADAAKSSFGGESHAVDKGKVAGAAADLLGAASDYGKFDETKGLGKYVDKAEDYLNQYEKSHSAPHGSDAEPKPPKAEEPPKKENSGEGEHGGSGFGDYLKVAEGFLKK